MEEEGLAPVAGQLAQKVEQRALELPALNDLLGHRRLGIGEDIHQPSRRALILQPFGADRRF